MTDLTGLGSVFEFGKSVIERIWPDANKRSEEMRKLEELRQSGDLERMKMHVQLLLAQIDVNKYEAQHPSIFVAGWRPFIGWAGGFSFVWAGVIHPLLTWVWAFAGIDGTPPPLIETGSLGAIVTGMLGVGGMRSYDKMKKTDTRGVK